MYIEYFTNNLEASFDSFLLLPVFPKQLASGFGMVEDNIFKPKFAHFLTAHSQSSSTHSTPKSWWVKVEH